jgi:hypothetical protein
MAASSKAALADAGIGAGDERLATAQQIALAPA